MKKILWFSRHAMTAAQKADLVRILGDIHVTQVNGTAANVHVPFVATTPENGETEADDIYVGEIPPLKELVKSFDEVAVVLPIGMIQQLLPFVGGRLLQAVAIRRTLEGGQITFSHDKWQAIKEVKIVTEDL